jgi:hypothetical protein
VLDTSGLAGSTRGDIDTLLADRAEFPAPQEHGHLIAIACDTTLAAGTVLGVQLRASRAATIDGAHRSLFEQRQSVFVDIATGTCGAGDSLLTAAGRDTAIARLRTLLGSVAPADIGTSRRTPRPTTRCRTPSTPARCSTTSRSTRPASSSCGWP